MNELMLLKSYAARGFKDVRGWLGPDTIAQILTIDEFQKAVGIRGPVGEIGVHHGKLFILLYLLAREHEQAVAIDIFENQKLNLDKSGRGSLDIFLSNLSQYAGGTERLKVVSADSTTLSGQDLIGQGGGKLRLLSIDGGHLARIVRHDLNTAANSLCEGGVVILDDYFNPEFPGVCEGTNRYFISDNGMSGLPLRPFLIGMNKVYLTTADHADQYLELFSRRDLGRPLGATAKFSAYADRDHMVYVTELFDSAVLGHSPDKFDFLTRLTRRTRHALLAARARVGDSRAWESVRRTLLGRSLARVINRLMPYR